MSSQNIIIQFNDNTATLTANGAQVTVSADNYKDVLKSEPYIKDFGDFEKNHRSDSFRKIIEDISNELDPTRKAELCCALYAMVANQDYSGIFSNPNREQLHEWYTNAAIFYSASIMSDCTSEQLEKYFRAIDEDRNKLDTSFILNYAIANGIQDIDGVTKEEQAKIELENFISPAIETLHNWGVSNDRYAAILGMSYEENPRPLGQNIKQTDNGSCTMLAVIGSLLRQPYGKEYLHSLISEGSNGEYSVTFNYEGGPFVVTVNMDDSKVKNAAADAPIEVQIIEAAYQKFLTDPSVEYPGNIPPGVNFRTPNPFTASELLLGPSASYNVFSMSQELVFNTSTILIAYTTGITTENRYENIDIVKDHAYSVEMVSYNGENLYRISNPWNSEESTVMTEQQLRENFVGAVIASNTLYDQFVQKYLSEHSMLQDYNMQCHDCNLDSLAQIPQLPVDDIKPVSNQLS